MVILGFLIIVGSILLVDVAKIVRWCASLWQSGVGRVLRQLPVKRTDWKPEKIVVSEDNEETSMMSLRRSVSLAVYEARNNSHPKVVFETPISSFQPQRLTFRFRTIEYPHHRNPLP